MTDNTVFQTVHNEDFRTGGWITITAFEIQQALEKQDNQTVPVTPQGYRQLFIDLLIHKINHNTYGSGSFDVLHEERKQEELRTVFEVFPFSDEEMTYLKKRCGYIEDLEPFSETCECGSEVSGLQYAQTMSIEGRAVCTGCISY